MIIVLIIVGVLAGGFLLSVVYSAIVMANKVAQTEKAVWDSTKESLRLVPRYQHAVAIAAQCWCDPRTVRKEMDVTLAKVFAEKIAEYIEALQWCSGASDFQKGGDGVPEGCASAGFDRVCRPLMTATHKRKLDISKFTPEEYKRLRKYTPELAGLKGNDD